MTNLLFLLLAAAPIAPKPSEPAPKPDSERRALRLVIDPATRVYDISVAFSFTTTVWFPVDCLSVTVGDPDTFAALINPKFKNRVIIAPQLEVPNATTNVTIDCDQGVRVVLNVTQGRRDAAVQSVEFEFSSDQLAQIRAAVASERQRGEEECVTRIGKLREDVERESAETLLRNMLRRFAQNEDVEL